MAENDEGEVDGPATLPDNALTQSKKSRIVRVLSLVQIFLLCLLVLTEVAL